MLRDVESRYMIAGAGHEWISTSGRVLERQTGELVSACPGDMKLVGISRQHESYSRQKGTP